MYVFVCGRVFYVKGFFGMERSRVVFLYLDCFDYCEYDC